MKTVCVPQDAPANALALSPDFLQVAIAGSHVFKIFSIEENDLVEKANLRVGKNLNLNFSCSDVVWNPNDENVLATGATNGAVVTWNLKKAARSKLDRVFKDHERTVNKVNFHPSEAHLLLSGSQDGAIRLFDLRRRESVSTFKSNAEFVRDIQFSPHTAHLFCAGTENGNVQLWDMRRTDRFERQFTGHRGPVFSIDWHPEIKSWMATGSRDRTIKIWDLNDLPNFRNTIKTVASVARVRWRPNKRFHIASCALTLDCSISVWDIRRPYIPLAAFNEHRDVTSGIAWRGHPNSLLSVGKDCTLYHHAFEDATRPVENANPVGIGISTHGHISNANQAKEEAEIIALPPLVRQHSAKLKKQASIVEQLGAVHSSLYFMKCEEAAPFSSKHIIDSAQNYWFTGRSLADICDHNAAVARKLNRLQVMVTWQMLQILYAGTGSDHHLQKVQSSSRDDPRSPPDPPLDMDQKSTRHMSGEGDTSGGGAYSAEEGDTETDDTDNHEIKLTHIVSGMTTNSDFFFGDGEISQIPFDYGNLNNIDISQDWTLPTEAFQPRQDLLLRPNTPPADLTSTSKHHSQDLLHNNSGTSGYVIESSSMLSEVKPLTIPNWTGSSHIVDMLHHYSDCGDVQMAVTVIIVLGPRLKGLLSEHSVEHWFLSYVDILHRLKLWNTANQVIQAAVNLRLVQEMNQLSTTVSVHCGKCGGSVPPQKYICRKCSSLTSKCDLCHGTVRGLFVWCQGCSHGGHLNHIQEWVKEHRECPAGCGHLCEYT